MSYKRQTNVTPSAQVHKCNQLQMCATIFFLNLNSFPVETLLSLSDERTVDEFFFLEIFCHLFMNSQVHLPLMHCMNVMNVLYAPNSYWIVNKNSMFCT